MMLLLLSGMLLDLSSHEIIPDITCLFQLVLNDSRDVLGWSDEGLAEERPVMSVQEVFVIGEVWPWEH